MSAHQKKVKEEQAALKALKGQLGDKGFVSRQARSEMQRWMPSLTAFCPLSCCIGQGQGWQEVNACLLSDGLAILASFELRSFVDIADHSLTHFSTFSKQADASSNTNCTQPHVRAKRAWSVAVCKSRRPPPPRVSLAPLCPLFLPALPDICVWIVFACGE